MSSREPLLLSVHNAISETNVPLEVFAAMERREYRRIVVSLHQDQATVEQTARTALVESSLPVIGFAYQRTPVLSMFRLAKFMWLHQPDVVHLNHTLSACVVALISRLLTRSRIVLTLHRDYGHLNTRQRMAMWPVLHLADEIACNSQSTLRSLRTGLLRRQTPSKARVCYNGVDFSRIERSRTVEMNSRPKGRTPFIVSTVCRLTEEKDVATLVRGFSRFQRMADDTRLVVVGDGSELPHLEGLVKQLGICQQVDFRGALSRDEIYRFLWKVDLFVVCSRTEGFCNAAVEAMAAGRCVLASSIPALEEVIGPSCARFFDVGDDRRLAELMLEMYHAPASRQRLAKAARERAWRQFRLESTVQQYSRIYERLVA